MCVGIGSVSRAGILQNGLDVVRSALRVHEHPAVVLPLDPVERGENLVVLRRGDVRHELPAPRRHQEVEVPDLGGEAIVREVGDRFELAEIVRARGRLHDEGEPGPVQDLRSLHRVPPGATHLPEAVVTIGIERIEREREPPRSGLREAPRHVLRDAARRWCRRRPRVHAPTRAGRSRGCRAAEAARRPSGSSRIQARRRRFRR